MMAKESIKIASTHFISPMHAPKNALILFIINSENTLWSHLSLVILTFPLRVMFFIILKQITSFIKKAKVGCVLNLMDLEHLLIQNR